MSGIAALVTRDGRPAPADDVLAMLDAIPYRGPDGSFARAFGRAVLGHARMAVTASERAEVQPLTSTRTGCAIVADVRLDNRAELRERLSAPTDSSDAQLILRAYERWGLDMPRQLQGDFAFAIWDPREQRLLCARDASGQRTLFYRADAKTFAAASEIHQLLQDPMVPLEPDEVRIRSALLPATMRRNAQEQARTYYDGITSVLPGHQLVLTRNRPEAVRFARLEPPATIRYKRSEDYVDHFRDLFFTAVAQRMATDTTLGALLSGGLDSSSVVSAVQELYRAGRVANGGFTSFSAIYEDDLECDERPLMADLQKRYGFDAHFVTPDPSAEREHLEPDGFHDRPEFTTSGTTTCFDAAQAAGVRVLLTGELADNYLRGGGVVFDSLLRQGKIGDLWRYLRAYRSGTRESLVRMLAIHGVAPMLTLAMEKRFMAWFIERQDRLERWRALPPWIPEPLRGTLLDASQRETLAEESRRVFASHISHYAYLSLDPPEVPLIPRGRPVEIWRPFAARSLQEFALAIPPEHLYDPGNGELSGYGASKQLLRRSLRGMLPDSIRLRTHQTHFTATFRKQVDRQWQRHSTAFGPDGHSHVAARGYIDGGAFWARLQATRAGQHDSDVKYAAYIIGLETWLRNLDAPRRVSTTVASRVSATPAVLLEEAHSVAAESRAMHVSAPPDSRTITMLGRR